MSLHTLLRYGILLCLLPFTLPLSAQRPEPEPAVEVEAPPPPPRARPAASVFPPDLNPLNTIGEGDFTLEAWLKADPQAQAAQAVILSTRSSGQARRPGMMFFIKDTYGNRNGSNLSVQGNGVNYEMRAPVKRINFLDGECHHVAAVRQGGNIKYYGDGQFLGETNYTSGVVASDQPLRLGFDQFSNPSGFPGEVWEVRIWKAALNQQTIAAGMRQPVGPTTTNLIAYYPGGKPGQRELDQTGNYGQTLRSPRALKNGFTEGCFPVRPPLTVNDLSVEHHVLARQLDIRNKLTTSMDVRLLNAEGKAVLSIVTKQRKLSLDLRDFDRGTYQLSITTDGRQLVHDLSL